MQAAIFSPTETVAAPQRVERVFDVVISATLLVLLLPLLLGLAIAVTLSDGGPALFHHQRVGRGGKRFGCLKFRSMRPDAEQLLAEILRTDRAAHAEWKRDHKLRTDPRITPIGGFLRVSSLDELPQLINVLRGEMSLVGPRPITPTEISRYGDHFQAYCSIRPGVTGLWQVSGRSDLDFAARVRLDVEYARNRSVRTYFALLFATIPAVLLRKGAR